MSRRIDRSDGVTVTPIDPSGRRASTLVPRAVLILSLSLVACAPFVGRATPMRVRFDEPAGVRVLYDVQSRGPEGELVAADDAALEAFVAARQLPPVQPPVDFRTHVVVGASRWVPLGAPWIVGLEIDENARIVPFEPEVWLEFAIAGPAGSQRVTTLLAIPRRMLPPPGEEFLVALASREVRARVPPLPAGSPRAIAPRLTARTEDRGVVSLPSRGSLALRTLSDGSDVWIAHHADGSIDVLAADAAVVDDEVSTYGTWRTVVWNDRSRWFSPCGFDARGGALPEVLCEPLDVHAFEQLAGDRLRVGERVPGVPHAERARSLFIEGAASEPYSDRTPLPLSQLAEQPIGSFVRVEADLRVSDDGAQLCPMPHMRVRPQPYACEAPSYRVLDVAAERERLERGTVLWIDGPLVVRWRGDAVDHPIRRSLAQMALVARP